MEDDLRLFGVTGNWSTAALDPGVLYSTVRGGGRRFMAAWAKEEENASKQWQKKKKAEEADKVEVTPGVTVASLSRFRAALIGPTQEPPKRRRLCRQRNLKPWEYGVWKALCVWVHGYDPGRVSDGSRLALCQTLFIECPFSIFFWHVYFVIVPLFVSFLFFVLFVLFISLVEALVGIPLIFFWPPDHVPD